MLRPEVFDDREHLAGRDVVVRIAGASTAIAGKVKAVYAFALPVLVIETDSDIVYVTLDSNAYMTTAKDR